jgi:hypothetical protein
MTKQTVIVSALVLATTTLPAQQPIQIGQPQRPLTIRVKMHDIAVPAVSKSSQSRQLAPSSPGQQFLASTQEQRRNLDITLENLTPISYTNLTVRYYIADYDSKNDQASIVHKGEKEFKYLLILRKENFATPSVTVKYRGGGGNPQFISPNGSMGMGVSTSPIQMGGYAVEVYQRGELVAAQYSPPQLRQLIHEPEKNVQKNVMPEGLPHR